MKLCNGLLDNMFAGVIYGAKRALLLSLTRPFSNAYGSVK